jgi:hypothetical protein
MGMIVMFCKTYVLVLTTDVLSRVHCKESHDF